MNYVYLMLLSLVITFSGQASKPRHARAHSKKNSRPIEDVENLENLDILKSTDPMIIASEDPPHISSKKQPPCITEEFIDSTMTQVKNLQNGLKAIEDLLKEKQHTVSGALLKGGKRAAESAVGAIKTGGKNAASWIKQKYDDTDLKAIGNTVKEKGKAAISWIKSKYNSKSKEIQPEEHDVESLLED